MRSCMHNTCYLAVGMVRKRVCDRRPRLTATRVDARGRNLRRAGACLSALHLPHNVATQVEAQLPARAVVLAVVFDFSALDRLIARDAQISRTVTSEDPLRNHDR